jgi:hypothetical protein
MDKALDERFDALLKRMAQGEPPRGQMATVHSFRAWNQATGEMLTATSKSTAARIKAVGGEIIEGTAERVPVSALDEEGRYRPR